MNNIFIRSLIAFIIILIGIVLVLQNLDVIDMNMNGIWPYTYSILFIIFGLKWFIDDLRNDGGSWIFGSFLFVFGSLLVLGELQVIMFNFEDIFKLWPLLIIYIGFSIIGKPKRNKNFKFVIDTDDKKDNTVDYKTKKKHGNRFSLGDHQFNEPNWKVEPMDLYNAAGDYYIDFSKAFIPEKETPIRINSWAGDIQILMPENVACRIDASVKAGEVNVMGQTSEGVNRNVYYESEDYQEATRKLTITLKLKAGSVRVDKV
ncbi:cell wall-active antibiotics response protein LiaF [Virgibacillus necropolis]|uniref:cell wall-active antibiotics response protein LiaF n=1 Tax=Virgibacillus necropolis TaxID=163877 RepID=UPI00384FC77C